MHEEFIPIVLFLVIGAVTIVSLIMRYYKRQLESQEIIAAIEKGVEVKFPERKQNRLLPGLVLTFVGFVMAAALAAVVPEEAPSGIWLWGLLPVAVGAAFIIVHKLEKAEEEKSTE